MGALLLIEDGTAENLRWWPRNRANGKPRFSTSTVHANKRFSNTAEFSKIVDFSKIECDCPPAVRLTREIFGLIPTYPIKQ
jgi:hypothetical protein